MKKQLAIFLKNVKKNIFRISLYLLFSLLLLLLVPDNVYIRELSIDEGEVKSSQTVINLPSPPPYPVNSTGNLPPQVTARGIVVKDIASGVILLRKNERQRFSPASTTKIISALVALDYYDLDDILEVKTVISQGRSMGLAKGDKLTFESLLYGTLVHSANDATQTVAENYQGEIDNFVSMMNKKTAELNLTDTHFTNPIGFDSPNHYTTPYDLAIQAQTGLQNKIFAKIVGTRKITVPDVTFTRFYDLVNVNRLLGQIPGVAGVKTGFTENAGETLISEIKRDGRSVLIVLLKSEDRFAETKELIDWVFDNFTWQDIEQVIQASWEQLQEDKL